MVLAALVANIFKDLDMTLVNRLVCVAKERELLVLASFPLEKSAMHLEIAHEKRGAPGMRNLSYRRRRQSNNRNW